MAAAIGVAEEAENSTDEGRELKGELMVNRRWITFHGHFEVYPQN